MLKVHSVAAQWQKPQCLEKHVHEKIDVTRSFKDQMEQVMDQGLADSEVFVFVFLLLWLKDCEDPGFCYCLIAVVDLQLVWKQLHRYREEWCSTEHWNNMLHAVCFQGSIREKEKCHCVQIFTFIIHFCNKISCIDLSFCFYNINHTVHTGQRTHQMLTH